MRWRASVMVLACVAGCGDDVSMSGEVTGAESSSSPSVPTSGDGSASETAAGSEGATTGPGTSTGEPGGPPAPGGARVLYLTNTYYQQGPSELFFVDCSGEVPAPPVRINEPLAPDTTIFFNVTPALSPRRRWLSYVVGGAGSSELWFLRLDGPTMGPPRRVQLPPMRRFERPVFSGPDEQMVAFRVQPDETSEAMWLCHLEDDGGCAPTQWSPLLADNGIPGGSHVAISPDGRWLAYTGDPEGDGIDDMLLARTEPGDAGSFVQVSAQLPDGFTWDPEFSAVSPTFYYTARDPEGVEEELAVDLTSDPPGAPVVVAPTPNATRFLFNADRSAYLRNAGSDLELVTLAGTVGTPVRLNAPEQAAGRYSTFVRQDQGVMFYVRKPDDPEENELFLVDISGPVPSAPLRLGEPLPPGVEIEDYPVFGDDERQFFTVIDDAQGVETLWAAGTQDGAVVELTASLPPVEDISDFFAIAEGHGRVAFTADGTGYHFDLAGAMTPVAFGAASAFSHGGDFSADAQRLYYSHGVTNGKAFLVDVGPSPGEPVQISDPAHGGLIQLIVVPPGG